ncbi:hypothetical protein B0J17DRAFT_245278 [Rhizoctonia solani]|nr:hypothetical protein B0J17DRAFT_245278 [Rhizoctonia solani]
MISTNGSSRVWRDLVNDIKSLVILFKTFRQNQLVLTLSRPASHVYEFARDSKLVLDELISALGIRAEAFDPRLDPDIVECHSNRCPAADEGSASVWKKLLGCVGWQAVEYCSRGCQIRDWRVGCPNPHRAEGEFLAKFGAPFSSAKLANDSRVSPEPSNPLQSLKRTPESLAGYADAFEILWIDGLKF